MGKDKSKINRSYIREAFKQAGVQLSSDALALIVHDMRRYVSVMALKAKRYNIRRVTSDLIYLLTGDTNKKGNQNEE